MEPLKKRAKMDTMNDKCENFIDNEWVKCTSGMYLDVIQPATGKLAGIVGMSNSADVDTAVQAATKALVYWSSITVKTRVQFLMKFHQICLANMEELIDLIVLEHGKTKNEAKGSILKGLETVEYSCSMPQLIAGNVLEVSRGVECKDFRDPLGVIASIVPFNFPMMVPMWSVPIALACGNCVILKPSEKVPFTMKKVAELFKEAGLPAGVFQIINGGVDAVNAICDHEDIKAVTFVGSSKVASIVESRCHKNGKRVIALGGAKNHLVAYPDCNIDMCAQDIVNSYSGCSGQRCMAASVLLVID